MWFIVPLLTQLTGKIVTIEFPSVIFGRRLVLWVVFSVIFGQENRPRKEQAYLPPLKRERLEFQNRKKQIVNTVICRGYMWYVTGVDGFTPHPPTHPHPLDPSRES